MAQHYTFPITWGNQDPLFAPRHPQTQHIKMQAFDHETSLVYSFGRDLNNYFNFATSL